jgi:F-type H+-transporting ATPase subunit b
MKRHLKTAVGFAVSFFLFALPFLALAAEESHGEHGGSHEGGGALWSLVFPAINFVLFLFVLRQWALPAVRDALRQRRDKIVTALNEAKRAKEEAEALRREYEQKLAGLAAEQEKLRIQALEAAEREKKRILEEAQRMAERSLSETQQIAQREMEEARRILRREAAQQAVQMATAMLQSRLTPADQSRFVQDLVTEVNDAGNTSR